MLSKIALRNIHRSVRDYAIYFITIVVGVALFYAFNAIGDQAVLFDFQDQASERVFELSEMGLGMFTYLVIAVLAFLIIYANRFLIRRRKKEFGTYLLLGMKARQVSYIILLETVIVGIVSLVVGVLLGFLLSQASCFFTAQLIDMPIKNYTFVFSVEGLKMTVICFAAIYVIVALFNVFTIRRCKVVNLLYANDKNERTGLKRLWPRLIGLPVSVACIVYAYYLFSKVGILEIGSSEFTCSAVLMIVGTFLFFWSVAGAFILLIRRAKGLYFHKLTMFSVSQVASRMNTAFASISVICVMLFFSLTVFACGNGLTSLFTSDIEEINPYDVSICGYASGVGSSNPANAQRAEEWDWNMESYFSDKSSSWHDLVKESAQIDQFTNIPDSQTYIDIANALGGISIMPTTGEPNDYLVQYGTDKIGVIGLSQINKTLELAGQEPLELGEDQFALDNTMTATQQFAETMSGSDIAVKVFGKELSSSNQLISLELQDVTIGSTALMLIVPDSLIQSMWDAGLTPATSILNFNLTVDREKSIDALSTILSETFPGSGMKIGDGVLSYDAQGMLWPFGSYTAAWEMIVQSGGLRLMFTYMALYVGLVFLVITAVMLAIQQLSETSDSVSRYNALARLGCDGRMLFRSMRSQVLVYFLAPLALAACHTICAVYVVNDSLFTSLGDVDLLGSTLITVALTVVVYGVYLVITYFGSKSIVRASLGRRLLGE